MILDQIVLHNFGAYRGRHVIDLSPPRGKPIVLFGALNGSGKTTLLDALQLVLYGRFAECSNRGDLSYEEFLRRSINHAAYPHDGAALELQFRHRTAGDEYTSAGEHTYRVHRSWMARDRGVKERIEVLCDGAPDAFATESWAERVEDFIPVRLSKFFFFDGEKIESLADLDRSSDVLATAIQSLLGLDLVDQLATDLKVVERRNRGKQRPEAERAALEATKVELDQLETHCYEARAKCASQRNELDRHRAQVRALEEKFRKAGGEAFEKRAQVESEHSRVDQRLQAVRERLRELAAASAPLLLVSDLLDTLASSASEHTASGVPELAPLLEARDARTLEAAKRAGATNAVLAALREFLRAERASLEDRAKSRSPALMSNEAQTALHSLRSRSLTEARALSALLLKESDDLQAEIDRLDRMLASAPDQEALAVISHELSAAREALSRAEASLHVSEEEARRLEQTHKQKWDAYEKRMHKDVDEQFRELSAERIVTYSEAVRGALTRFRSSMVERHVRRIEQFITEGLHHLLRKESLVSNLSIDPSTYKITLFGDDKRPLSPERLSAGERQLLAIATIWALARASGRPLPVVIDTPLGRLDSIHRNHLVQRYFPMASHQVILLSTDEEIDEIQFAKLKPLVGRAYRLTFDDRQGSTRVEQGYFW
jgi:DNA sulfur modification protein DndD